jgi:hypothetical protein
MPIHKIHRYFLPINPEPWAVGKVGVGRRNGKTFPTVGPNAKLVSFQQEVKEWFEGQKIDMIPGDVELEFFFWRRLDKYQGPKRTVTANEADATNMQKATEDALQGILYPNDKAVRRITSEIVAQGTDIEGAIGIRATMYAPNEDDLLPGWLWEERLRQERSWRELSDNRWPPPAGL